MIKIIVEITIETRNQTKVKVVIQNGREISGDKDDKEKGDRISLANSSRGNELGGRRAINEQRKRRRRETFLDPRNPNLREIHFALSS